MLSQIHVRRKLKTFCSASRKLVVIVSASADVPCSGTICPAIQCADAWLAWEHSPGSSFMPMNGRCSGGLAFSWRLECLCFRFRALLGLSQPIFGQLLQCTNLIVIRVVPSLLLRTIGQKNAKQTTQIFRAIRSFPASWYSHSRMARSLK